LDPDKQSTSLISELILEMPELYLDSNEILALVKTLPLYARLGGDRFPEIAQAEREQDFEGPIFSKLKEEWYMLTYGSSEKERNLTYHG